MKLKILRSILESALSRCYHASEKRASDSIVKFSVQEKTIQVSSRGGLAFYVETCDINEIDQVCEPFYVYTSTILEFIKHASTDEVIVARVDETTCIVSTTDKKQKIALQIIDTSEAPENPQSYLAEVNSQDFVDIVNKINSASKFCSADFQQHPLNAIHLHFEQTKLTIQSANGPMFYRHECPVSIKTLNASGFAGFEMYIPKKAPVIIKNVFADIIINSMKFSEKLILLESEKSSLILYIESNEQNIFPNKVLSWLTKERKSYIKLSHFEISKTVKFFNGIFDDPVISLELKNEELYVESIKNSEASAKDTGIAAKEVVSLEESEGSSKSSYNSRYILDCLEAIAAPWINIDFVEMQGSFCIARITHGGTLILLCPTTS